MDAAMTLHRERRPVPISGGPWEVVLPSAEVVHIYPKQAFEGPEACLAILGCFTQRIGPAMLPGGVGFEMASVVIHITVDGYSALNFCKTRDYHFAIVVFGMYVFHLVRHFRTYLDLPNQVRQTLERGYYTQQLLDLRDSQRGVQGIPVLMVAAYGWIWAVTDKWSLCSQQAQILLGVYGVAAFSVERELRMRSL